MQTGKARKLDQLLEQCKSKNFLKQMQQDVIKTLSFNSFQLG